ncbi:MAG: SOS response-associated peptidase [Pseudomonadota bacterium]
MAARYQLAASPESVTSAFGLSDCDPFPPRYNIAPTQPVLIVREDRGAQRTAVLVRWGLIPSWVRDPGGFPLLIEARGESVLEKPSFRGAMRHKRCLVPATGFYKWTGAQGARQPHLLKEAGDGLLAFAGLWEDWLGADGSEMQTMAIVTVVANADVSPFHDRMPAIIPPQHFEEWLDVRCVEAKDAVGLLAPAPVGALNAIAVSQTMNNPRNDGSDPTEF